MNYSPLTRAGEKIISLVREISGEQELASLDQVFPFMDAMQRIFPQWVFIICPIHHPGSRYISDNCEHVLGYKSQFVHELFPTGIMEQAHEDDRQDLKECFSLLHDYLENKSTEEDFNLRLVFQFRFKHREGHYILVQDEKASFKLQNGTVIYYSILKDISDQSLFKGVTLDIYRQDTKQEKLASFRPSMNQVKLSKRETELVLMIRKGLRTKEIADHLKISHHTVRNIRQKMFEKYSVNNSIELLNKAI
jgi:DNA-binding CsgD family transcriptional regulator